MQRLAFQECTLIPGYAGDEAPRISTTRRDSGIQRLVKAGHLRNYERGSQGRALMLDTAPPGLPTLQEAVRSLTVARVDSPLSKPKIRDWEAIAEKCNSMLDPSLWGAPPWSADRWAGLAGVLAIAGANILRSPSIAYIAQPCTLERDQALLESDVLTNG
jgi:hypothetical protein